MTLALAAAQQFLFTLLRVAAWFTVGPAFGEQQIPARIRLGLALAVSASMTIGAAPSVSDLTIAQLFEVALRETLLGLGAGLGSRLVFEASTAAGFLAGTSMGLGFGAAAGTAADPPVVSQIVRLLALGGFVTLGGPARLIGWVYASLHAFPVGQAFELLPVLKSTAELGLFSIALTVRVVFPLLAAALLGHVAMAIAGRSAPQINLSSMGFSVAILAGGTALYHSAPIIGRTVAQMTLQGVVLP